jgi:oligopeptide transport system substrate-binding protein
MPKRAILATKWSFERFLISLIFLVIGIGCQSPSQKSKTGDASQVLRINIQDEPQTLDPRKARSLSGQILVRMLFEGLTRINKEERAELALANSVNISSDLKTYTFHLKESIW